MIESVGSRPPAMDPAMMKEMRQRMFDRLDTNKDGSIDTAELAAAKKEWESKQTDAVGGAKPRRSPLDLLEKIGADGNGDGTITKSEYDTAFDSFDQKMKSKLIEAQSQATAPQIAANDSSGSTSSLADLFKQFEKKVEEEKTSGQSTELQDLGKRLGEYLQKLLQTA